jgi:parallel beta-helix repeat protein
MKGKIVPAIMLTLLLTGMLTLAFNLQPVKSDYVWTETIYVQADGSIQPPTAPISSVDNVTYTLTDNITGNAPYSSSAIIIQRDNIIIDGAGYTVQGAGMGYGNGITLSGRSNVTIKNTNIDNFGSGVFLFPSSNYNSISGNNITNNVIGIYFYYSSNYNSISGNNITANTWRGIWLYSSSNNSISGNNITANSECGILLHSSSNNSVSGNTFTDDGLSVSGSYQNSVENNTVNGKPLVYLEGVSNYTVADAGQVILVGCDNIRVEGLNLSRTSVGVKLLGTSNSTISGNNITNNRLGIQVEFSSNSTISGNNITNNYYGILLEYSSDYESISGNNITNNYYGIHVESSSNKSISGNNITNNYCGIRLDTSDSNSVSGNTFTDDGLSVYYTYQNSVENNTVNGKPLVYLEGVSNYTVADAGQVILVGCDNIRVEGLNLSRTTIGIQLWGTSNSTISGNNITNNGDGIGLEYSSNNNISGNNITANVWAGIELGYMSGSCSNNTISGNNITNNGDGILLYLSSDNNNISGNNITNNGDGIGLEISSNNSISGNNITNNGDGIGLEYSSNNSTISGNNITNNGYGIYLYYSSNNSIYHNHFVNNAQQAYSSGSISVWDDGYPSGGNYWSDYDGIDLYSGPHQKETGSDGIGDTPYVIDEDNQDNYPLMKPYPWDPHDVGITSVTTSKNIVGQGYNASINVIMFNYGNDAETFNVTIYANQTMIGEIYNIDLTSRNSATLTFKWNTSGFAYGNYTISAVADTVPGETYTADNTFIDGWVYVGIPGDINADGIVEMMDFYYASLAFGSTPTSPNWNPSADVNADGIVEMMDFFVLSQHFGQHYP